MCVRVCVCACVCARVCVCIASNYVSYIPVQVQYLSYYPSLCQSQGLIRELLQVLNDYCYIVHYANFLVTTATCPTWL